MPCGDCTRSRSFGSAFMDGYSKPGYSPCGVDDTPSQGQFASEVWQWTGENKTQTSYECVLAWFTRRGSASQHAGER